MSPLRCRAQGSPPWLLLALITAAGGWAAAGSEDGGGGGAAAATALDGSLRRKSSSEARASMPGGGEVGLGPQERRQLNAEPSTKPSKLAVCILGQLSRLEMESKVRNLLVPEAKRRGVSAVHGFFVLDLNSNSFVTAESNLNTSDVCSGDYYSPETVKQRFGFFYKAGIFGPPVNFSRKDECWGKYGHPKKPGITVERRTMYHYRQWTHLDQCMKLVIAQEQKMGEKYEAVVKVRDNGIVVSPFVVPQKDRIVVKKCFSWWGYNDKVAVIPRQYAEEAFGNSKVLADKVQACDSAVMAEMAKRKVGTAEQYLKFSWRYPKALPVLQTDELLPVVDGRCVGQAAEKSNRSFCIVPNYKDCHPAEVGVEWEICKGIPCTGKTCEAHA